MKKIITIIGFVFFVLVPVTFAQNNIREVDFKNFTYEAFCADDEPSEINVKNGEFLDESENYFRFSVQSVNYGDLNADGKEEAAIVTVCHPGGT